MYVWHIADDIVYADGAVAALFGFEHHTATAGMPIASYLDRIVVDDRQRVAKAISDTMLTGFPYQESYRIQRPGDSDITIIAYGHCFMNANGDPSLYAGIAVPFNGETGGNTPLLWHCLKAYELAKSGGKSDVAENLLEVIRHLVEET